MTIKIKANILLTYSSLDVFNKDIFEQVIADILVNNGLTITIVNKTSNGITNYDRRIYSSYYKNLENVVYSMLPMVYYAYIQKCYLFFSYYNNYVSTSVKIVLTKGLLK